MLSALDYFLGGPREIVIAADSMDERARRMVHAFQSRFIPNKAMIFVSKENSARLLKVAPLIEGKTALKGKPTAYICENFACKTPITDLDEIVVQLDRESHDALIQEPQGVEHG
jgi:uncharacterized protein YyaL (SSP411 family)